MKRQQQDETSETQSGEGEGNPEKKTRTNIFEEKEGDPLHAHTISSPHLTSPTILGPSLTAPEESVNIEPNSPPSPIESFHRPTPLSPPRTLPLPGTRPHLSPLHPPLSPPQPPKGPERLISPTSSSILAIQNLNPIPQSLPDDGTQPQVKFENALDFLDQVKMQFQYQPKVYNQFLDIMKDFKAQCIDTPGVIARVSELFKGHKNLILGFNTFLPPGYKIENIPDDGPIQIQEPPQVQPQQPPLPPHHAPVLPGNNQRKQPEFDHARNYVKKIKMRFSLQPHIYKAFLEILHTYHKEQHTIKEVYEQVANLFHSHPDLLEEFTQFLPDPVASTPPITAQTRTKKPARKKEKEEKKQISKKHHHNRKKEKPPAPPTMAASAPLGISSTIIPTHVPSSRSESSSHLVPNGTYEELNFFYRVKQRLNNQELYYEFLKCLNLFSYGIISRLELVLLVKDLLQKHVDLFDWFKQFIGFDDPSIAEFLERNDEKSTKPMSELIDFKNCRQLGPSYRAYPKTATLPVCSGRTELCNEVLNDVWVSVPKGSEDFGFKNSRKNQYEELLFKCEDDRFELDLVIELNASTIRALEYLSRTISETKGDIKFKLDTSLDVLNIRSIERIYGEKGGEIIDALYKNPTSTIPILLKRLRQKDREWTRARREWNKIWREVNEKNYYKSLDHQSAFFKQNDKKRLNPKVLLSEIRQSHREKLKNHRGDDQEGFIHSDQSEEENMVIDDEEEKMEPSNEYSTKENSKNEESTSNETQSQQTGQLKFEFTDPTIYGEIYKLVTFAGEKTLSKLDKEKIDTFFNHFVKPFFFIDELPTKQEPSKFATVTESEKEEDTDSTKEVSQDDKEKNSPEVSPETRLETTTNSENTSTLKQIFFGNSSFYIFFRYFQILYERLKKAKEMAKINQINSNFAFLLSGNRDKKLDDEKDKSKSYLATLYGFLSGAKDQNVYEDECRSLFGVQAYILFTMDKVINSLTKHLQTLLSEEICSKILGLYSYELSRNFPQESVYYSNCVELLEEERCFRIDFIKVKEHGTLIIKLLDSQKHPPEFVEFSLDKQEKWSQYVEHFIGSEENKLESKKHNVFLKRNQKKTNEEYMLENLDVNNGLECRICLSSYRLFFVENTEDYLYRKGSLSITKQPSFHSKVQHLESLIQKKFGHLLKESST